jgi:soluble lytic murein transglycosylase-like protein
MDHSKRKLALWIVLGVIISHMQSGYRFERQEPAQSEDTKPVAVQEEVISAPIVEEAEAEGVNSPSPVIPKKKDELFHLIIDEVAYHHEVDPALVKAIIMAESSYDPKAISKKGAKGLMQLMPLTAESFGVEDAFDPTNNIRAGVAYFRKLLNQFNGDERLALAAYNAGSKKVRQYKGVPPFEATQLYIKKVFAYYETYKTQSSIFASNTL